MSENIEINNTPNELLKSRATVEDLLGLPPEGWEAIGKKNEEELEIYLKDVCELEPPIPTAARLRGGKNIEVEDVSLEAGDSNPIKQTKKKKKTSKEKEQIKPTGPSPDDLLKELGIKL